MRARQDYAGVIVKQYYELFKKKKNPIYAWRAYQRARLDNLAIPKWVLLYLDASARAILAGHPAGRALRLTQEKGGPSKFAQAETTDRDLAIRDEMRRLRRDKKHAFDLLKDPIMRDFFQRMRTVNDGEPPPSLEKVCEKLESRYRLSSESLRRIYHAYKRLI